MESEGGDGGQKKLLGWAKEIHNSNWIQGSVSGALMGLGAPCAPTSSRGTGGEAESSEVLAHLWCIIGCKDSTRF